MQLYEEMNMQVEKNKEYIVDIIDNGFQGEGIAKIDGFTIFIPNAIKGEKIKILIVKVLASHAFGKIIEIIKQSDHREESDCTTYKRCGGCSLRHIKYNETLKIKQNAVQSLVNKTLENKLKVEETLGMDKPYHYRNKAQYPIGLNKEGKPVIGVFANRTHEIIPIETCYIQNKQSEEIAKYIFNFLVNHKIKVYDEKSGKGLVRHIVTKIGIKTNEVMCIIVINGNELPYEDILVNELTHKFENINLYGNGYIKDILGDFIFKISPMSFYQVNPVQAEKLYNIGVELADINKNDIVFDLYCGIGTISLFMSKFAKEVYGVEIVDEAIVAAKENACINNVTNTKFIAGDVEKVLDDLVNVKKIIPDIIMLDPPRRGLDNTSIENIRKVSPKKVIYISCNPATLVRDLSKLEDKYNVKSIKPVDMFPFTSSVECCAVLELKNCK